MVRHTTHLIRELALKAVGHYSLEHNYVILHKNPYESLFNEFGTMPLIPRCDKSSSSFTAVTESLIAVGWEFRVASISSNSSCPAIQSSSLPFLTPNP